MASTEALLDTSIISLLLRNQPDVMARGRQYETEHGHFNLAIITRFEVLRGLKAKGATTQLTHFNQFCARNTVLPLTDVIVEQAADIYADLYKRGTLIEDADILIAATAMVHGLNLITNNERHFSRVTGLTVENWLK